MSYNLFLSDVLTPENEGLTHPSWLVAKTYEDFKQKIDQLGIPAFVFLGHDLSPEHRQFIPNRIALSTGKINYEAFGAKTGLDCVCYLIEVCKQKDLPFPEYIVSSDNIIGQDNIKNKIYEYKRFWRESTSLVPGKGGR